MAKKSGVCIAVSVTINRNVNFFLFFIIIIFFVNRNADDDQFDGIVDRLLKHDKARVSLRSESFFGRNCQNYHDAWLGIFHKLLLNLVSNFKMPTHTHSKQRVLIRSQNKQ